MFRPGDSPVDPLGLKRVGWNAGKARGERDPVALIEHNLRVLAARAEQPERWPVCEAQLVVRVVPAAGYPVFRRDTARRWKGHPDLTTDRWPPALGPGQYAALVEPIMPGRVGRAAVRVRLAAVKAAGGQYVARPTIMMGDRGADGDGKPHIAVQALATWIGETGDVITYRLAPPVLEDFLSNGRFSGRRLLLDLGLTWPLPPPDGL